MKKLLLFIVTIPILALDTALLTSQKQAIFEQKQKAIEANARVMKYNWISPLSLGSSISTSEGIGSSTYNARIQFNQDIYRSGGIGHQMAYAESKLAYDMLGLEQENAMLYEELLIGRLELEQLQARLRQNEYKLKNAEIEVFLKTQLYKSGNVDITEMNNALMNKNSMMKSIITAKENISNKKIVLAQLTGQPVDSIRVKSFSNMTEKTFLQNNFTVLQAKLESQLAGTEYAIEKSDYLPSVSVSGQLGYQDSLTDAQQILQDKNYHSLGLSLSMPIDFNAPASLEAQKATYLQRRIEVADVETERQAFYQQQMIKVRDYEEYTQLTQENMDIYRELIDVAQKGFKTGYSSGYDLQTLENTQKIDELELEINRINIQIALAQLHFETNLGVAYYE